MWTTLEMGARKPPDDIEQGYEGAEKGLLLSRLSTGVGVHCKKSKQVPKH